MNESIKWLVTSLPKCLLIYFLNPKHCRVHLEKVEQMVLLGPGYVHFSFYNIYKIMQRRGCQRMKITLWWVIEKETEQIAKTCSSIWVMEIELLMPYTPPGIMGISDPHNAERMWNNYNYALLVRHSSSSNTLSLAIAFVSYSLFGPSKCNWLTHWIR